MLCGSVCRRSYKHDRSLMTHVLVDIVFLSLRCYTSSNNVRKHSNRTRNQLLRRVLVHRHNVHVGCTRSTRTVLAYKRYKTGYATTHQRPSFELKLRRNAWASGEAPDPVGSLQHFLDPLAQLRGPTCKKEGREETDWKGRRRKGRRKEGNGTPTFRGKVTLVLLHFLHDI